MSNTEVMLELPDKDFQMAVVRNEKSNNPNKFNGQNQQQNDKGRNH